MHMCAHMQDGTVSGTDAAEEVGLTSLLMPSPGSSHKAVPAGPFSGDAQEEEVELGFFLPSLYLDNI